MTCWPHQDLPGAGPLDEHELDAACWRKRQIVLTREQSLAVDDTAGLCGSCGGNCPAPDACQLPDPHKRQRHVIAFLAIALGATICALCLALYLRAPA